MAKRELGLPDAPVILSARGLAPVYNPDVVLSAFELLRERVPDAVLVLKHLGPGEPALAGRSVPPGVRVVGNVPYEQLPAYFRAADVCLSIPRSDSSPRSVWEAMACGCPCVLSDLPWTRELIEDDRHALLVSPEPEATAASLERVLTDQGLADRLRVEGRALVERHHDRNVEMNRLSDLYATVAAGRQPLRRVLMLAYAFPPLGGAGVQRTLKFVKYLPEHGWEPTVVSVRWSPYQMRDPTLAGEMPRRREGAASARAAAHPVPGDGPVEAAALDRARAFVTWPDNFQGWLPGALAVALREIRRSRPDVLYTTSAPYVSHLAGLALHRMTGIPWVADFRDEWAANPHLQAAPRALRTLSRRAERAVAASAHVVVVGRLLRHRRQPPGPQDDDHQRRRPRRPRGPARSRSAARPLPPDPRRDALRRAGLRTGPRGAAAAR